MSDTGRETLFEIVCNVLQQFEDANLKSEEAIKRIAGEICDRYYDGIVPPDDESYDEIQIDAYMKNDDILQQGK